MSNKEVLFDNRGLFTLVNDVTCTCGDPFTHLFSCETTRCETGVQEGLFGQPREKLRAFDIEHHFDRAAEHQDAAFSEVTKLMDRMAWYPIRVAARGMDEHFEVPNAHVYWHNHFEILTGNLLALRARHHRVVVTMAELLRQEGRLWLPSQKLQQRFVDAARHGELYDSMRGGSLRNDLVHWGHRVAVEKKVAEWDRIWPDCHAICLDAVSSAAIRGVTLQQEIEELEADRRGDDCVIV